jgi:hypothetical protein
LKKHALSISLAVALSGTGWRPAVAGVIPGTGSAPTATQLGATDAVAFQVAENGPGHALVVPYFTVQNGQMSVLHLVNTDLVNGKAVKLRFRGAGNGDSLLSLYVLMSAGDVWTGVVTAGADGRAQLGTADNSCTLPKLPAGSAQPFLTDRLDPGRTPAEQANQTREGIVEAIVAADIPSRAVYGVLGTSPSNLYTAIRQVNGVPPCQAVTPGLATSALDSAALMIDTGSEASAAYAGFATPTGGVAGTWYIIDVPGSTTFSGAATAIRAVNAFGQPARGNYVFFPQTSTAMASPEQYTADPLLVSAGLAGRAKTASGELSSLTAAAVVQARSHDLPDLSTPYYLPASELHARTTAGDLTRALAVTSVSNQYATDESISAKTDWVFSMPTKRYSVGVDYSSPSTTPGNVFSVVPPAGAPNNQYFHTGNVATQPWLLPALACLEAKDGAFLDRESSLLVSSQAPVFMGPRDITNFCGTAQVLSFLDSGASALSAQVARETRKNRLFTNGWSRLDTTDRTTGLGLPIRGSAFVKLTNPQASPGVAGNYGITWPHMFGR